MCSNKPKNAAKRETRQAGATKPKSQAASTNGATGDKKAKKEKSGRAGRPKAKTAEELDAEMQDYFGSGEAATAPTNGAQPAASNGADTGMVDEVM
jgi:THO complex subunit 4